MDRADFRICVKTELSRKGKGFCYTLVDLMTRGMGLAKKGRISGLNSDPKTEF